MAVVLEDLEREVPWRGVLVAAVGVPGEFVHGLGTGLVVACLEGRLVRPDVPEPATLGAVRYGQLVSVMVMEAAEEMLEVCARCVCELETDFEDAVVLQLVMYLVDMVRLPGVDQVRSRELRHRDIGCNGSPGTGAVGCPEPGDA